MQSGSVVDACVCIEYVWNDTQEINTGCLWGVWGIVVGGDLFTWFEFYHMIHTQKLASCLKGNGYIVLKTVCHMQN